MLLLLLLFVTVLVTIVLCPAQSGTTAGADCREWLANEISLPDLHLTYKLGWTLLQTSIFTQCKA